MNKRKTMKKFSLYKKDGHTSVINWLFDKKTKEHFFKPDKPWQILGTDVTEFHANGFKVFLSVIIDFYNNCPIASSISKHPDKKFMVQNFKKMLNKAPKKSRFILHSDQGSVYRSDDWKKMLKDSKALQSMSRKGKSGDNAPTEGLFGRLKQTWFNQSNFNNWTYQKFVSKLEDEMNWYNLRKQINRIDLEQRG
jgi:putative transposase